MLPVPGHARNLLILLIKNANSFWFLKSERSCYSGRVSKDEVTSSKGDETRQRIIAHALRLASSVGLEAVTIGDLASDLGLSKSGLFAHFKSKERLQLDILDAAAEHFRTRVFVPALSMPRGQARLAAIFENWLRWVTSPELPGGCIFLAGALEWDDRQGPVRERLVSWFGALTQGLEKAAQLAVACGDFRTDLDVAQFAYEMHAVVMKYHVDARLLRHAAASQHANKAWQRLQEDARASCPQKKPEEDR